MKLISKTNNIYILVSAAIAICLSIFTVHVDLLPYVNLKAIAAVIFLMIVIYSALRDGFLSALLTAIVAQAYFFYSYSIPGHVFSYTPENLWRVTVIGLTLFAIAYIIGRFRQSINDHIYSEQLARQKAEKLAEELHASGVQKEKFISIASHELKTPITSMKLLTHILQKKATQAKDKQTALYIKKIDNQVNNLITLTTNLLDASRISTGKLKMRMERFDINQLLNEKVEELAGINDTHKIIKKGSVTGKVLGDKNALSQVIINLVTNAVRYSPEGSKVIVSIKTGKDGLSISVQDFGIGIASQHQKKIFDQFYQVKSAGTRGLGIGLYICAQITKQHHGKISVKSNKEKGSTFTITIPMK